MKKTVITGNSLSISDISNLPADIAINGGSTQAVRDGKNKFNLAYIRNAPTVFTVTDTGVNLTNAWVADVYTFENIAKTFKPNTTYTMRAKAKVISRPSTILYRNDAIFYFYRQRTSTLGAVGVNVLSMSDKETVALGTEKEYITAFTTPEDMTDVRFVSYTFNGNNDGSTTGTGQGEIVISEIMLVEGEYTSDNFPDFELYGVSPSPEHISPIESVADDINLFDKTKSDFENGEVLGESKKVVFTLKPNTEYTCSSNDDSVTSNKTNIWFNGSSSNYNGVSKNNSKTVVTDENGKLFIAIRTTEIEKFFDGTYYIKLQQGTIATPYSPYGQGSVEVTKCNKNLAEIDETNWTLTDNIIKNNGRNDGFVLTKFKVRKGQKVNYSLKLFSQPTVDTSLMIYIDNVGDSNLSFVGIQKFKLNTTYTKTYIATKDCEISSKMWGNANTDIFEFQFWAEIDKTTDYEEHQEQSYIIPTQQEMLEGDYLNNKEEVHNWGKLVLNGTEEFSSWTGNPPSGYKVFYSKILNTVVNPQGDLKCNTFKYMENPWESGKNAIGLQRKFKEVYISIESKYASTLEEFKAYLKSQYDAGTPVIIYYKLAKPINLELTEEQIKQLYDFKLYSPITNIYMSDKSGYMTLSYVSIDDERGGSINPTWIEKNGEKVFPITHSRALLGGISSKAYNINDAICGNNWNNVVDNGLYYDENGTNRPPIGLNTYPDNLLIEVKNIKGKYVTQEVSMFNTELFDVADREVIGYIRDRYGRKGSYNSDGSITWSNWRTISSESDINRVYIEETSSTATARKITMSDITDISQLQNKVIYIKSISTGTSGTATLNVNGYGAKPLRVPSNGAFTSTLEDNWIITDQIYSVSYDGTNFNIVGAGGSGGSGYVKSSDNSNKDWVTMTKEEFDNARANGLLVDGTVYNVLDDGVTASGANPVGSILLWFGLLSKIPANYVLCDGRLLNIEDYPTYADRYGTTYGGDGATTVGVPNMKGRVVVQLDSSQTEFNTVGKTGGSKSVTLTESQIPAHTHKTSGTEGATGTKTMILTNTGFTGDNATISDTSPTGDGQAHTNLQPYIVGYYIIKVRPEAYTEDLINLDLKISMLKSNGDGTKYLADDGTYKTISGSLRRLLTSIRWYINYNCI